MVRDRALLVVLFLCLVLSPAALFAQYEALGRVSVGIGGFDLTPTREYERLVLTVSMPDGSVFRKEYTSSTVTLRVSDLPALQDGTYTYELRLVPHISPDVIKALLDARANNDDGRATKIRRAAGIDKEVVQSGSFSVMGGAFVPSGMIEPTARKTSAAGAAGPVSDAGSAGDGIVHASRTLQPRITDQVIPDDLIVQGSECVGLDCVNNESFGFDTIRLKENNTRIKFDDTSTSAGFPNNDWQLTANDSASGGANKFSIEDITGSKVPFTITAGAATNSIFVDSTGRLGLRTSTPVLDIHVNTGNTPALRLEQNSSGGFSAQTWDVAGNEANFFVRDSTGGSQLPFRIRPGAPTSSIDISSSGAIGIGTASPNSNSKLDVNGAIRLPGVTNPTTDNGAWQWNEAGVGYVFQSGGSIRFRTSASTPDRLTVALNGNAGINCNAPASQFVIFATSNCSGSSSSINAGATQFTATSSRTLKENLEPVAVPDLLQRMLKIGVYKYDFIAGPKDRVGLMAEDFHQVFGRGSDKVIDGNEVQMALWLAVQELAQQNKQLQERIKALEEKKQ